MEGSSIQIILYVLVIGAIFYFIGIRPQKKEQDKRNAMLSTLAIGDYCVTNSGFYGKIIDISSDMVIVEFGNKNCRIPMMKTAIARIEKEGDQQIQSPQPAASSKESSSKDTAAAKEAAPAEPEITASGAEDTASKDTASKDTASKDTAASEEK